MTARKGLEGRPPKKVNNMKPKGMKHTPLPSGCSTEDRRGRECAILSEKECKNLDA
jgi:hypothetical protein